MHRFLILIGLLVPLAACSGGESTQVRGGTVDAPDALGSFAVGHTMFNVVDDSRDGRALIVNVWYPVDQEDAVSEPRTEYPLQSVFTLASEVAVDDLPLSSAGPSPFLVFSHGFGGINTQSTQLMEALASHGFVVASPEHTGNTALDGSDPTPAENRVPDVSLLIDEMFARSNTAGDRFEGRIDEDRVGVLGHSFGGATAMGAVAGWAGADPDPRVKAIGVIAGSVGEGNFDEDLLGAVTEPTILFVGTLDSSALANHRYAFDRMPNAEALFKVEVAGANHTHFANVCDIGNLLLDDLMIPQDRWAGLGAAGLIGPYNDTCTEDVFPIAEAHRLQNLYMVAHFKRFLMEQDGYADYLTADHASANEPAIAFESR